MATMEVKDPWEAPKYHSAHDEESSAQTVTVEMSGDSERKRSTKTTIGPSLESMYFDMRRNDLGRYEKTDASRPTDNSTQGRLKPPYTLTTYYGTKEKHETTAKKEKTMLEIRCADVIKLMKNTMSAMLAHEGASAWSKAPVVIQTSSVHIPHCFRELRNVAEHSQGVNRTQAQCDLQQLLDDLACIEPDLVNALEAVENEQALTFEKTWCLFPPGSRIVGWPFQDRNSPQAFVVHRHNSRGEDFAVSCWAYDYDGNSLVRSYYEFLIRRFQGVIPISELICYPTRFHYDEPALLAQMIERGKKFRKLCIATQPTPLYQCTSFFVSNTTRSENMDKDLAWLFLQDVPALRDMGAAFTEIKADDDQKHEIMIDAALCKIYATRSYLQLGQLRSILAKHCDCELCSMDGRRKRFEKSFRAVNPEVDGQHDMYALLPSRLHSFLLRRKQWGQVLVDTISVEENQSSGTWENDLAMDQTNKDNIRTIVSAYFERERCGIHNKANIQDPIRGKGEGIVILLHGVPGVGKTMTAEALARSMNRRLLRIDAADFEHNNPGQVSKVFNQYFHMAGSWGALLLLDEADVFLQLRKRAELAQNALVSVLLRELEYFKGVLIMTTNRIVSIDYAMQSRIHFAITFKDLSESTLDKIWKNFRNQLNDANSCSEERSKIDSWYQYTKPQLLNDKFTGRDIRNVFMCAQLLGYPQITEQSLKTAVMSTIGFHKILEKNNQKLASQNAGLDD